MSTQVPAARVRALTLSDGSIAYDVVQRVAEHIVTFATTGERQANELAAVLNDLASIDVESYGPRVMLPSGKTCGAEDRSVGGIAPHAWGCECARCFVD